MAWAVLSDTHSNLTALTAVIGDARARGVETFYHAGDAAGYGPEPNECAGLLQKTVKGAVTGNHDRVVTGAESPASFNDNALAAALWSSEVLSPQAFRWLSGLDYSITVNTPEGRMLVTHASPRNPEQWYYIFSQPAALEAFSFFKEPICVVGHTHQPFICSVSAPGENSSRDYSDFLYHSEGHFTHIEPERKYLVNAGSVGQPRDGDPRASYLLCADKGLKIIRVEYDISATEEKMRSIGLPEFLYKRLYKGI